LWLMEFAGEKIWSQIAYKTQPFNWSWI